MKTSELKGAALDWAVAKCEHLEIYLDDGMVRLIWQQFDQHYFFWTPTTDWSQGGPIIEREKIALYLNGDDGWTGEDGWKRETGPTPLVAAMRVYVASKLGDEVEIPEELKGVTA